MRFYEIDYYEFRQIKKGIFENFQIVYILTKFWFKMFGLVVNIVCVTYQFKRKVKQNKKICKQNTFFFKNK